MRKFYLVFPKLPTMSANLSWSVIVELFSLKSVEERNYYMNQTLLNHLSVRELREMIKSKAYNRLSYADKENIKLMDNTNHLTIEDMIKDPILIKADNQMQNLNEQALHKYIINMLEKRFLELGSGFALVGHEVKMVEENHTFKIDLLFFNYELNSFVVVELKTRASKPQDVGQLEFYVHLVDKQLKKNNHNKTVGLLIVKKKNQYILEYTTNKELFVTTYKLML